MPPRVQLVDKNVEFFSTGSTLLDLILGGGWARRRIFNIVGDKSTGKTLIAVESFANFDIQYSTGLMRYAEAEAAFDVAFASQLGFPNRVERPDDMLHTVEEFRDDYYKFLARCTKLNVPGLYILDSLDALSDDAEVKKFESQITKRTQAAASEDGDVKDKGSYGAAKAKKLSEMFRLLTQDTQQSGCSLGIISQIRDNIGVTFGETKTRSGGHSLDFYASQVLWLAEMGKIKRTVMGIERPIGIEVMANCKKLKVGFPFRKAGIDILFGYGVDDQMSMLKWLKAVKSIPCKEGETQDLAFKSIKKDIDGAREEADYATLNEIQSVLKEYTVKVWTEIESVLAPKVQKYNQPVIAKSTAQG